MKLEKIYSVAKSTSNVNDFKAVIDNLITGQPVTAKSSNTFELVNVTPGSIWLVAHIDKGCELGNKLSVKEMGIHNALPDSWNVKEGWIKWNVKGMDSKEIDVLKGNIKIAVLRMKEGWSTKFLFSYT